MDGMAPRPEVSVSNLNSTESLKLQAMEAIVRKCHCFDGASVFGGYVRDYAINRVLPNDLNICFRTRSDMVSFLRILTESFKVDKIEPNH